MPGVIGLRRNVDSFDPREGSRVEGGVATSFLVALRQMAQLDLKDGRLDAIHPAVPTHHRVLIFLDLAVITQNANLPGQFSVVRHDCSRFAKGAKILAGIKTKATGMTD